MLALHSTLCNNHKHLIGLNCTSTSNSEFADKQIAQIVHFNRAERDLADLPTMPAANGCFDLEHADKLTSVSVTSKLSIKNIKL